MTPADLRRRVRIPVFAAPMFLVSGPDLVIACCQAGVVGSFPAMNARTAGGLDTWLARITAVLEGDRRAAPYALNLIVRSEGAERFKSDLAAVRRFRPVIAITSVGAPYLVVDLVHGYGGLVLHDVASIRHAHKAVEAGVDGLILLTAGAGGHCGSLNAMAFLPQVRAFSDGIILLAGGICDGRAVRAAEVRERAVRMVLDHEQDHASRWAAVVSTAAKIGCAAQTLHEWVKKAEALLDAMPEGATPLADKGYDSNAIRKAAVLKNAWATPAVVKLICARIWCAA